MNIKRAKQEIKDTIGAYLKKDEYGAYVIPSIRQRPLLLIGPPGIGKTQIMKQISQECQIGLVAYTITHHTRQSAIGLPFIEKRQFRGKEYTATEYTMSEIVASVYENMEQTDLTEGILFLDEINCVSETLAPAMLQFLQGKSFGNHSIPEGWVIVAAGNPPEYNKSVREFDLVTLDRIRRINVEPDFEVWKEYAARVNIHPAVSSYLNVRPQNFCRIETTVDGKQFATPRGWEDLSALIQVYEQLEMTVDREIVFEYIQFPKIARDFASYLELYYKYKENYPAKEILAGQVPAEVYGKLERAAFDERVSVVGLLLSALNESFRKVCQMAEKLELEMKKLREIQKAGEQKPEKEKVSAADKIKVFAQMTEDFCSQWEKRQENGLVSSGELGVYRQVSACLEQMLLDLQKENLCQAEDVWQWIQGRFEESRDEYEVLLEETGQKLEHAFDFMEAGFGSSQEMVLFVTELNTGFYSVEFLQEYDCERYYQYNRNLLFSEEEERIKKAVWGTQADSGPLGDEKNV